MMRALALVLVLVLVVVARAVAGPDAERFATMTLGFILIAASLVGEAGERLALPRLTGYLLVGLVSGPSVLNLVTPAMTQQLRLVNGLAVALIAFGAGMELQLGALWQRRRALARHAGWLVGALFVALFVATLAASPWLPFAAGEPWSRRAAIALMVAAVMATFSPTVVMAVLSETRAGGPLAQRVLELVVAGDLGVVLLFTLASTGARLLDGTGADPWAALGHVAWELAGSIVVGGLAGLGVYAYRRYVDRRSGLLVAAVCLVIAEVGSRVGLSALLCCLAAGVVVRNAAPEAAAAMHELLGRVRLPVLVVFFAAAGASLHVDRLAALAPVVAGLVLVRTAAIYAGNVRGSAGTGLDPARARLVPLGLVSQAGVTLGLAVIVGRTFPAWGPALETLFIATISVHELAGPVLFRSALARAGELPQADADAPPQPAPPSSA